MYKSLEEICEMTTKEGKPFWKIVQEDDCREQGISEGEAFEQMRGMYQAMREADDNYDGKLKSASGLVGTDGEKMHAAREAGTLLCGKFIGKVMEKALKTGESNACMKLMPGVPNVAVFDTAFHQTMPPNRCGTDCGLLRCCSGSFSHIRRGKTFFRRKNGRSPLCGGGNRRRDRKQGVSRRGSRRLSG